MDLGLKNKIIVISGAAGIKGSIGETILQHLADEGQFPLLLIEMTGVSNTWLRYRQKELTLYFAKQM